MPTSGRSVDETLQAMELRSASDDIIDVLEASGSYPQQAQSRHIWQLASFLPGQAAQGPMVAPAAWQLDVWSLHWQGCASTGQLPVFFGEGCIFITQVQ
ncbi:TPA: hypothetical protein ACH3X3_010766 [Trebouxia sp. C0006]